MSRDRRSGRALRVLVVDDFPDVGETISRLLTLFGHEPTVVTNGADALEAAAECWPDVAVIDILMPRMNGFELAAAIQSRLHMPRPLLVAHSGSDGPDEVRRCKEAGFDHFIAKPAGFSRLLELLAEHRAPAGWFAPDEAARLR